MKPSRQDLLLLRRNLLLLGAAIIGSAAILYGSGLYAEHAQKKLREAQILLDKAQQTLAGLQDSQLSLATYSAEHTELEARNIFGNEQRQDWIDVLAQLQRRHLVNAFHYVIAPQQTLPFQTISGQGNFEIHYSAMKLQFDLLHETQLLDFFDELRSYGKGWYQLEGCTLRRTAAPDAEVAAYLTAECNGSWITLFKGGTAQ